MAISLTEQRLIICEGRSDQAFFRELIRRRGLAQFDVFNPQDLNGTGPGKDGYKAFLEGLSVRLASPSPLVRGILLVADNDLDPAVAFANIQRQIREAVGGYGVPANPLEVARSTAVPGMPPTVVLMLPWTGERGALESLLLGAIYKGNTGIKACIDDYCRCTSSHQWDLVKQSKMRIQALLAAMCRSNPDVPLQGAWSQSEQLIDVTLSEFDRIADFLAGFDGLVA